MLSTFSTALFISALSLNMWASETTSSTDLSSDEDIVPKKIFNASSVLIEAFDRNSLKNLRLTNELEVRELNFSKCFNYTSAVTKFLKKFCDFLSNNEGKFKKVKTLNFSNNPTETEENLKSLLDIIKKNMPSLKELNISHNKLKGNVSFSILFNSLENKKICLKYLDISNNGLGYTKNNTPQNTKNPFKNIESNSLLKALNISGNKLDNEMTKELLTSISKMNSVEILSISNNKIDHNGAKYILEAINEKSKLTCLDVSNNNFGTQGAKHMADMLAKYPSLFALNLNDNNIGSEGAKHISQAINEKSELMILMLASNKIDKKGVEDIGDLFKKNNTVKELDLSSNNIGGDGLYGFLKNIHGSSLRALNISNNNLENYGALVFKNYLVEGKSNLAEVGIGKNNIDSTGIEYIAQGLEINVNNKLTALYLNGNKIGPQGAQYLSKIIKSTRLEELNVNLCELGYKGARLIINATKGSGLKKLSMTNNRIGNKKIHSLQTFLEQCNHGSHNLKYLNVSNNFFVKDGLDESFKKNHPEYSNLEIENKRKF
jgi:Ran GTPase-activating protein (RanGAP) involved in mRNA processing and transport